MDFSNIRNNSKKLEIVELPVERIKPFKIRTRDENAFRDLRKSISESGLKYPIGVKKIRKSLEYDYECIKGHGRLMSCESLGWKTIPCILYDVNDAESLILYILENENRENLSPIDVVNLMKIESQQGVSVEEIGRKFHVSPSTVNTYLGFLDKATGETIKSVQKKTINLEEGIKLSKFSPDEQRDTLNIVHSNAANRREAKVIIDNARIVKKRKGSLSTTTMRSALAECRYEVRTKQKYATELAHWWRTSYYALRELLKDAKFRTLLDKHKIDYSLIFSKDKV